jgi:hypothetical protein
MGFSAIVAIAAAASAYNGMEQRKDAKAAAAQATANAKKTAAAAERDTNAANAKAPDVASLLSGNQQAATGGAGSTMLTGPSGVDLSQLTLGKSTLLGG